MDTKEKVTFTKEQETLLIPLYAKAKSRDVFVDTKAQQVLDGISYRFEDLKIAQKTVVTLIIRAKQLDHYTQQFIDRHPNALILHLGCGLDSRCERVNRAETRWFDLDMPDVIALRKKFFTENETYHMIASSVTNLNWLNQIPQTNEPVLVIAEGLLMYLQEEHVKALFMTLKQTFPLCEVIFDAFSEYTVKGSKFHPSMKKTGAEIHWGIDDPKDMENWSDGFQCIDEWFFSQSLDIPKLGLFYRLMFRLTASIDMVRKAHRILYFRL